jgi:hypothetical protein
MGPLIAGLETAVADIITQAALNTSLKYISSTNILEHTPSIFKVKKEEKSVPNFKKHIKINTLRAKEVATKISDDQLENLIDSFVEGYDTKSSLNINNKVENDSLESILSSIFKTDNDKLNLPYFNDNNESCYQLLDQARFANNDLYHRTIEDAIIDNFMGEYNHDEKFLKPQEKSEAPFKNFFNLYEKSEKNETNMHCFLNKKSSRCEENN